MLDPRYLADRHIRPGWVRTIHSAPSATSDRVLAHVDSYRANIVNADDRLALVDAIEGRDGGQVGAVDETLARGKVAAIAIPAPVRAVEIAIG